MTSIADTGFVIALSLRTDKARDDCKRVYQLQRDIILSQSVLTEAAYMLTTRAGNAVTVRFLANLADTKFVVTPLRTIA